MNPMRLSSSSAAASSSGSTAASSESSRFNDIKISECEEKRNQLFKLAHDLLEEKNAIPQEKLQITQKIIKIESKSSDLNSSKAEKHTQKIQALNNALANLDEKNLSLEKRKTEIMREIKIATQEIKSLQSSDKTPDKISDEPVKDDRDAFPSKAAATSFLTNAFSPPLDVNHVDVHGYTPLIIACLQKDYKKAEQLIKAGADVNFCNDSPLNYLPLWHAVSREDGEMLKFLLGHGASLQKNCSKTIPIPLLDYINDLPKEKKSFFYNLLKGNEELALYKKSLKRKVFAQFLSLGGTSKVEGKEVSHEGIPVITSMRKMQKMMKLYLQNPDQRSHDIPADLNSFLNDSFSSLVENRSRPAHLLAEDLRQEKPVILNHDIFLTPSLGHTVKVVFYKNYVIKCNKGFGSKNLAAIRIYERQNDLLENAIQKIQVGQKTLEYFNNEIDQELDLKIIKEIDHREQKTGNCGIASSKLSLHGLAYLYYLSKGESEESAKTISSSLYRDFVIFSHQISLFTKSLTWQNFDSELLTKVNNMLEKRSLKAARENMGVERYKAIASEFKQSPILSQWLSAVNALEQSMSQRILLEACTAGMFRSFDFNRVNFL